MSQVTATDICEVCLTSSTNWHPLNRMYWEYSFSLGQLSCTAIHNRGKSDCLEDICGCVTGKHSPECLWFSSTSPMLSVSQAGSTSLLAAFSSLRLELPQTAPPLPGVQAVPPASRLLWSVWTRVFISSPCIIFQHIPRELHTSHL